MSSICTIKIRTLLSLIIPEKPKFLETIFRKKVLWCSTWHFLHFFFFKRCIDMSSICTIKIRTLLSLIIPEKPRFLETIFRKKVYGVPRDIFCISFFQKMYWHVLYLYYKNQNYTKSYNPRKTKVSEDHFSKKVYGFFTSHFLRFFCLYNVFSKNENKLKIFFQSPGVLWKPTNTSQKQLLMCPLDAR